MKPAWSTWSQVPAKLRRSVISNLEFDALDCDEYDNIPGDRAAAFTLAAKELRKRKKVVKR